MKRIIVFLTSFFFITVAAHAQSLTIDSMVVHSVGTELWLYGDFGVNRGMVTMEGDSLPVASWSAGLITCKIEQPAAGHVRVNVGGRAGKDRLLEQMVLSLQREWGAGIGHSGVEGSYDNSLFNTLYFCFDANTAIISKLMLLPYKSSDKWTFSARCQFSLHTTDHCGVYSAGASGADAPISALNFDHGKAGLMIADTSRSYSYYATHCRWDNTGNTVTTSKDSGGGILIPPGASFSFSIIDPILTVLSSRVSSGEAKDSDFSYYFFWAQNGQYGGTVSTIVSYSLRYPFPKMDEVVVPTSSTNTHIRLYPNPASGIATLSVSPDVRSIEVYDIDGLRRDIKIYHLSDGWGMDVNELPNGFYEVVCREANQIYSEKLVVSK